MIAKKLLGVVAVVGFAAGCAAQEDTSAEPTAIAEQEKIIGANDFVVVKNDGANIPEKYRSLIDAFGSLSMGCTATHIGGGVAITAGHCFGAPRTRKDNVPCNNVTVKWGVRADKPAYLTSKCTIILTEEQNGDRDYAIFKVDSVPPVALGVDYARRPAVNTRLTIFSHPQRRPLEWSQVCTLRTGSKGGWGVDQFSHQCDTEPGSSGATVLSDDGLKVVGIHDGGLVPWNYGTYLTNTPIAEFKDQFEVAAPEPTEPEPTEPESGASEEG